LLYIRLYYITLFIVFVCFLHIIKMNMFNSIYMHARRVTKKTKL